MTRQLPNTNLLGSDPCSCLTKWKKEDRRIKMKNERILELLTNNDILCLRTLCAFQSAFVLKTWLGSQGKIFLNIVRLERCSLHPPFIGN